MKSGSRSQDEINLEPEVSLNGSVRESDIVPVDEIPEMIGYMNNRAFFALFGRGSENDNFIAYLELRYTVQRRSHVCTPANILPATVRDGKDSI